MGKKKKVKASQNKAKDIENVKIELSIKDRLSLLNYLLPKESNVITLILAKDIQSKVGITQAEIKKHKIEKLPKGGLKFTEPKQGKKIAFTNAEMELLKTQVEALDKSKKVTSELLQLCLTIRGV